MLLSWTSHAQSCVLAAATESQIHLKGDRDGDFLHGSAAGTEAVSNLHERVKR